MSSVAEHVALANRNQVVLDHLILNQSFCADWAATVAFYKSLHVVEAIFAGDPKVRHGRNHSNRREILSETPKYKDLFRYYRVLLQTSLIARYLEHADASGTHRYASFDDYFQPGDLERKLLGAILVPFEHLAVRMLPESVELTLHKPRSQGPSKVAAAVSATHVAIPESET